MSFDFLRVIRENVTPLFASINNREQSWLSEPTVVSVTTGVRALRHVASKLEELFALERHARMSIMMGHLYSWVWLESICAYYSQPDVLSSPCPNPTDWALKLARHIRGWMETRVTHVTVRPSDYLPYLSDKPDSFNVLGKNEWVVTFNAAIMQQRIYRKMKSILQRWLGYPIDRWSDGQAWVLDIVTRSLGFGALFLEETWDVFSHFTLRVLGKSIHNTRAMYIHQLLPFVYRVKSCDASSTSSIAYTSLRTFESIYQAQSSSSFIPFNFLFRKDHSTIAPHVDTSSREVSPPTHLDIYSAPSPMSYGIPPPDGPSSFSVDVIHTYDVPMDVYLDDEPEVLFHLPVLRPSYMY